MKHKILLNICLLGTIFTSNAQVKIGNNPNTINANSLLELESTNKGMLPPRVALNDINSVAPLTATTPAGMLVYSSGGTLKDGYYYWNGTKWLSIPAQRDNFVLVKSASDFPAPVGGVITLATSTLYEINGTISLSDKIDLNNTTIVGLDHDYDKLIYTPSSGELFTGSKGGILMELTLTAANAGAKLFNVDAGGTDQDIVIEECHITGCNNVGLLKGFAGEVVFDHTNYSNNSNGIIFQNIYEYYGFQTYWENDNYNTYEKYIGAFSIIQLAVGTRLVSAANSGIGMDISGVTSITTGAAMKTVFFAGTGTYVLGSFSNSWEVECIGLNTEKDDVASGNLYISTTATTVIAAANTPVKVLGTTTAVTLFRITSPASNRLTYVGSKTRRCMVVCSLTSQFAGATGNKFFSFYIAKNGSVLSESKQKVKLISNTDQSPLALSCLVLLAPNDYIEVWVENNTDATDMIIQNLNLSIK
ncbi:MAG: hypothetical protein HY841_09660 [Bacteroidetes bacterium]|nr:hypothetical protein [Bacteroidota bacterium]